MLPTRRASWFGALLWMAILAPRARADQAADHAADHARFYAANDAGESAKAESLATAMLASEEARPKPDSVWIAELCFDIGFARGPDEVGLASLQRALGIQLRHLPPNDPAIGESEAILGEMLMMNQRNEEARTHARRGLDVRRAQPVPDDSLVASSWVDLGRLDVALGRKREAILSFTNALDIRRRLFGPADFRLVEALCQQGDAYEQDDDLDSARFVNEQALRILDRTLPANDPFRGWVNARLQRIYMDQGDLSRAIEVAYETARLLRTNPTTYDSVVNENNLAVAMTEFEDYEGAVRALEPVMPLIPRLAPEDRWLGNVAHNTLAKAYLRTHRLEAAMRLYREGESAALANPDPNGRSGLAQCVLGQADVLAEWKRDPEALQLYRRGIALNDSSTLPEPISRVTAHTQVLRLLEDMHDRAGIAATRDELDRIHLLHAVAGTSMAPTLSYGLARADQDLGREDLAWSEALEAEAGVREMLGLNFAKLPDSRALELARRKSYMLSQVIELAGAAEPDRWDVAWDRLVRTRGRVRAEVSHRRVPAGISLDSTIVRTHDAWVAAQRSLARQLVRGASASADSGGRAELSRRKLTADQAASAYTHALRARGADTTRVEVGLADVRAALAPGEALVSFVEYECRDDSNRVIAYVTRAGDEHARRLPFGTSVSLSALLAPWRARLATPPAPGGAAERECRRYGARVRARLWDPIAAAVGDAREVVIVGDGPVADVAWLALPVGASAYLVEGERAIRVLDAERELLPAPRAVRSRDLLAVGAPNYGEAPLPQDASSRRAEVAMRSVRNPCAVNAPLRFPPLPGTREEVLDIARGWRADSSARARVLLGDQATEAAVREFAPQSQVIHLATHGYATGGDCRESAPGARGFGGIDIDHGPTSGPHHPPANGETTKAAAPAPISPWMGRRVWLALAAADHAVESGHDADDGLLTAEEVVTLDLSQADWVVLSACHSGLAENWSREGALGMQRAFEIAGARSVIASQWSVEDDATAEWMKALYAARSQGETRAAAALAAACRHVLAERRSHGRSTHPFYWAAFRASGQ